MLEQIKNLAEEREFTISERQKNIDTFVRLKYVPPYLDDVAEVLISLVLTDYVKGPEEDKDGFPGEVYVFKKSVDSLDIYIKIRVLEEDGMIYMTVISFHN